MPQISTTLLVWGICVETRLNSFPLVFTGLFQPYHVGFTRPDEGFHLVRSRLHQLIEDRQLSSGCPQPVDELVFEIFAHGHAVFTQRHFVVAESVYLTHVDRKRPMHPHKMVGG